MTAFSRLPRNARVCIFVEPLWAMFGPLVIYYAPLYQKARGLDALQMGIINSAGLAASFVFFLFASPLTNRLGRRWTSLIFDTLSWTLVMVIWAFARTFSWFLIAAILNALVRIVVVSWNMLITEDAEASQRSTIHGWMHLIGSTGGIVTFIGGMYVSSHGVLTAMPVIYILGSISMASMFAIRHFTTTETKAGLILLKSTKNRPLLRDVFSQFSMARTALSDRRFVSGLSIFVIANIIYTMDFYRVLFLGDEKGVSPTVVATIPAASALFSLIVFFFIIPRLETGSLKRPGGQFGADASILSWASIFCALSQIALILLPQGKPLRTILTAAMIQSGYIVLITFRDAVFMNGQNELERSSRYGLVQSLTFLVSIPAGWLGGFLYSKNPTLPFVASLVLYLCCFMVARGIIRMSIAEGHT